MGNFFNSLSDRQKWLLASACAIGVVATCGALAYVIAVGAPAMITVGGATIATGDAALALASAGGVAAKLARGV
jgi:hypothetical protein